MVAFGILQTGGSMLRRTLLPLTLVVIYCCAASVIAQRDLPLLGDWAASLDIDGRPRVLWLKVSENPSKDLLASISINPSPTAAVVFQLNNITVVRQGPSWTLATGEGANSVRLDVQENDGGFDATYTVGTANGRTKLRRVPSDAALNRPLQGTYISPSGENIHIRTVGYGLNRVLSYLDERTGRTGFLYQSRSNSYVGGPSFALPDPVEVTATFAGDPVDRLTWQNGSRKVTAKKSAAYSRNDVQISVEGANLGCEILSPAGSRKYPAVVLVPGSGGVTRFTDYYILAELFAGQNIASLVCDKRGTGTSSGDWRYQSFEQQAQDIVAGMEYLRRRPEVDGSRVGIWAFSQGAYPGPIAAVTGNASFLILVAGSALPLRDVVTLTDIEQMKRSGTSAEEIDRYKGYQGRRQQALLARSFEAYENARKEYEGAAFVPATPAAAEAFKNNWSIERARLMWPYEPQPTLRKIKIPVLAFWGSEDSDALLHLNRPAMEQALREAGNTDYSLRVIAGAGHGLRINMRGLGDVGYAPEYISGMLEWLRSRVEKMAPAK